MLTIKGSYSFVLIYNIAYTFMCMMGIQKLILSDRIKAIASYRFSQFMEIITNYLVETYHLLTC